MSETAHMENASQGVPVQRQLLPDEPLSAMMLEIPIRCIPESETAGSRPPSANMRRSVARWGVLEPVVVTFASTTDAESYYLHEDSKVKFRLLAGKRRVLAAREAGRADIRAVIIPMDAAGDAVTLIENEQRSENPAVELEAILRLLAEGHDEDAICEACDMDKRRLEKRLRLRDLIPELLLALSENRMAVGVAEEAAKLPQDVQRAIWDDAKNRRGKVRGKDILIAKRVRQAEAAADLPLSMFGSDNEPRPDLEEIPGNYLDYMQQSPLVIGLSGAMVFSLEQALIAVQEVQRFAEREGVQGVFHQASILVGELERQINETGN